MADESTVTPPDDGVGTDQPDDTALENYQFEDDGAAIDASAGAPEPDAAPQEPPPLTPAEIVQQAEERAFQRMAIWTGRRDKDLLGAVENMINQRFPQPQPAPIVNDPATILENPDAWVMQRIQQYTPQVLHNEINRVTAAERNYTSSLIQFAGQMMDNDPLFADKELGQEVIGEIQKDFNNVNKSIPPNINAQLLISNAITNIYRKRAGQKPNALAGNTAGKVGIGGIKAGTPQVPVKSKVPKLSPDAQKLAQRWGYKPEDLERVFKDA